MGHAECVASAEKEPEMRKLTFEQIADYYRRSFITVDGLWFMKLEERYGFDTALDIDNDVWKIQPKIQARILKELFKLDKGIDALYECLTTRFNFDGYDFKARKTDNGNGFTVTISDCYWHNMMVGAGRTHLSGKVGTMVCTTEYKTWCAEFGDDISSRLGQQICTGDEVCELKFGLK